jgi:hypothetical protein
MLYQLKKRKSSLNQILSIIESRAYVYLHILCIEILNCASRSIPPTESGAWKLTSKLSHLTTHKAVLLASIRGSHQNLSFNDSKCQLNFEQTRQPYFAILLQRSEVRVTDILKRQFQIQTIQTVSIQTHENGKSSFCRENEHFFWRASRDLLTFRLSIRSSHTSPSNKTNFTYHHDQHGYYSYEGP